jgi:hypothetical protein
MTLRPTAQKVSIYGSVQRRASPSSGKVQHLAAEPLAAQMLWKLEREVGVEVAVNRKVSILVVGEGGWSEHTTFAGQVKDAINVDLAALLGVESRAAEGCTLLNERTGSGEAGE